MLMTPIHSTGLRSPDLSPTSSLSSSDERANAEAYFSIYNQQTPSSSQLLTPEPSIGVTPSSAICISGGPLSPYKPPRPTPQDSRNASVQPIETAPPIKRRRRSRISYTRIQISGLEACFNVNRYPDYETRETLATMMGMSEARVQIWFQNRRSRFRRQERDSRRMNGEQDANTGDTTDDRPGDCVCQSNDVTNSDDVIIARSVLSTSANDGDDEEEIDVVGITEEDNSSKKCSPSSARITSNMPVTSSISRSPQFCTKSCCCPPLILHQYRVVPSLQLPYHPALYSSQTTRATAMPFWNASPFFRGFPPLLSLPVSRSIGIGAPMTFR